MGYPRDASAVEGARWAIYPWNYWEARERKGSGHLSGDPSLSAAAMGTNDAAAEGSTEARSVSINVRGYDCRSTTQSSLFAESMKGFGQRIGGVLVFFVYDVEAQMQ